MSISINPEKQVFTLQTANTTYQMKADGLGTLFHLYYGARAGEDDLSYAVYSTDSGQAGNPYEVGFTNRDYCLDTLPQEISTFGASDYRITGLKVRLANGSQALRLRFKGYEIRGGKYALPELPAVYAEEGEADTLVIHLEDSEARIEADLYYGVLENADVITRAMVIKNSGNAPTSLEKAASLNLDFQNGDFDLITFYGGWAREREYSRKRIGHGIESIQSVRGASSAQYNPAAVFCAPETTETSGEAYGVTFLYSGEFLLEAEKDALNQTRVLLGISPEDFSWELQAGESFVTPEAVLCYSDRGLGLLSNRLHDLVRKHIVRGKWRDVKRPVLLNNWEGTYFDFTGEKLISMAKDAKEMGVELFVLDDGWFGKRDNDRSGLGDWTPNEKKLGCTIEELGNRIREAGLLFGLWFEPETISEDSELYRTHPDWAVRVPGKQPALCRYELILDMSRKEVQDYLIAKMGEVIRQSGAAYIKWDFNRNICDKYTDSLPAGRQGEFAHRFVLGTYRVLEALLTAFPDLLIEGCSSGGARFDYGMLYYTPQIWTSDDTDPIERLSIQYGTSFFYPVNTMGAHVSASPNHQTGRKTSLSTRAAVAMSGTFGYELDPCKLTPEEKDEIREQIKRFTDLYPMIEQGDYFRLTAPESADCVAWEEVTKDGTQALITAVYAQVHANRMVQYVCPQGLRKDAKYEISLIPNGLENRLSAQEKDLYQTGKTVSGLALMNRGLYLPRPKGDYSAWQILLTAK